MFNSLINSLHAFYRKDIFVNDIMKSGAQTLTKISDFVSELKAQFFFDTLTFSLTAYEKLLDILPTKTQSLNDRKSAIEARWKASAHNSIKLIKDLCECWKNGEIHADFINGKIQLEFIGGYGVPKDLDSLLKLINEVKPAHIPFEWKFKYLLIKTIHKKMTINEMQSYNISQYGHKIKIEV